MTAIKRLDSLFLLDKPFGRQDLKFIPKRLHLSSADISGFKVMFINSLIKQGKKLRAEY